MNDDSLEPVLNMKSSTGRALTPQLKRHNITPQRNSSAGRSKSNPKANFQKVVYESQSCNRKLRPHASKRLKQRWENDNLFGLRIFLSKLQISNPHDDSISSTSPDIDHEWNEGMMEINWSSLFGEILLPENSEALKAYLACSTSFASSHDLPMKTLEDCVTEWEKAEYSWKKVEKRLRKTLTTAVIHQPETRNFISMLEDILLEMDSYLDHLEEMEGGVKNHQQVPFVYSIPHEMENYFARPVKVSKSSKGQLVLQITLRDSPYHRLLLHATCQFHGRNSKSITEKVPNSNISFRTTHITSYASRRRTGHHYHTVSLIPFILSQNSLDFSPSNSAALSPTTLGISEDQYEIVDIAL